jgi:hypothetical protein
MNVLSNSGTIGKPPRIGVILADILFFSAGCTSAPAEISTRTAAVNESTDEVGDIADDTVELAGSVSRHMGTHPADQLNDEFPDEVNADSGDGADQAAPSVDAAAGSILYHGGPVARGLTVYMIYYGDWSIHPTSMASIDAFLHGLHTNNLSSDWLGITHAYTDSNNHVAGAAINVGAPITVGYTYGRNLVDSPGRHPVYHVIDDAIRQGRVPNDPNGLYFVLPASDVNVVSDRVGTICRDFCGFHTYSPSPGRPLKWGVISNSMRCGTTCKTNLPLPYGDGIADPAANILAHEITETATDFALDAWYDANGFENADKCAWKFGSVSRLPNGGTANIHDRAHGRYWLIQQNWARSGGCTMGRFLPLTPPPNCNGECKPGCPC